MLIAVIFLVTSGILFVVALSDEEYAMAFICFVIASISLAYILWNKAPDVLINYQISNREKNYVNLVLARDSGIKNLYVKEIIDKTIVTINKSNKKEKVMIAVPRDFYSLARKKEYDEVIRVIKSSGFNIEPDVEDCVAVLFAKDECYLTYQIKVW